MYGRCSCHSPVVHAMEWSRATLEWHRGAEVASGSEGVIEANDGYLQSHAPIGDDRGVRREVPIVRRRQLHDASRGIFSM